MWVSTDDDKKQSLNRFEVMQAHVKQANAMQGSSFCSDILRVASEQLESSESRICER